MNTIALLEQFAKLSAQTTALTSQTSVENNEELIPAVIKTKISDSELENTSWSEVNILLEKAVVNCENILKLYEGKKIRIENSGELTAHKESANIEKIEKNKKRILELESKISGLMIEIANYQSKRAKRDADRVWFDIRYKEIQERKKHANNYIPFYGIVYAIETNNMIDDYRRKRNDWIILNEHVKSLGKDYNENLRKQQKILMELSQLTADNLIQEGESVKITELLTILNQLIVNFQNFLSEVRQVKNRLTYNSEKKAQALKDVVDKSYQEISQSQNLLNKKINEYSNNLPKEVSNELKGLL